MSDDNEFTMSRYASQKHLHDAMRTRIREQAERIEKLKAALEKARDFLDGEIAVLPCESRQRDLPEETWERAMFIRDLLDVALAELEAQNSGISNHVTDENAGISDREGE